jgi:hypothetical protein
VDALRWRRAAPGIVASGGLAALVSWLARSRLGVGELYPDEANRALVAVVDDLDGFRAVAFTDVGHLALLRVWLAVVPHSVPRAFVPSVIGGIVGPVGMLWWCRRLSLSWVASAGAAVALAIGNVQAQHVGSLKPYVLVSCGVIGLLHLGLSALQRPGARTAVPLAVVACIGAVYAGLLVPVAVTTVAVVAVAHRRSRGVLGASAVGVVAVLGWYLVVQRPQTRSAAENLDAIGRRLPLGPEAVSVLGDVWYGVAPWSADPTRARAVGWAIAAAALVGAVVAAVTVIRRRVPTSVVALVAAPLVVGLTAAATGLVHVGSRADIWLYPSLLTAAAVGVEPVVRRYRPMAAVAAVVALATVVATVEAVPYPDPGPGHRRLAELLAPVPSGACVVLDPDVQATQFLWSTPWSIEITGRVPGTLWVRGRFPGRCVVADPGSAIESSPRAVVDGASCRVYAALVDGGPSVRVEPAGCAPLAASAG